MHRRGFFATLAAGSALAAQEKGGTGRSGNGSANGNTYPGGLKIDAVEIWRVEGHRPPGEGDRQVTVNPLHIYEEYRPKPRPQTPRQEKGPVAASALYIKIKTGGGLEGFYGPIDKESAIIVHEELRSFLSARTRWRERPAGTRCSSPIATPGTAFS